MILNVARYSDDLLDQIRRAADVVEVIARSVPLKRSGKSWKGCCPFHQEKTPSFHVYSESGIWKCFGCGEAGSVFTYLVKREGLSFPEAVRQLARETGIALDDDEDPQATARARRISELRAVMEWACRYFEKALRAPSGEPGRAYFKGRRITGATAKEFRLGWAPPGWDNMLVAAREDRVPEADLLDCGLVIERDPDRSGARGFYDRYRERVVFPIGDWQGRIIAFGARTLGTDEPKYINSPETPLYTKGRHLYALHLAKQEMLRLKEGAVMEGYTDVILAHQAGFKVAVAGLGTALTADQATTLVKYAKKLYLIYDGDAAGLRAAEKAIPSFLPQDVETRVCVLPGGQDPADVFAADGGAEAFRASLAKSREAFDHLVDTRSAAHDTQSVPGRSMVIEECLESLVGVRDEVRRDLYLRHLSERVGVAPDILARRLALLRAAADAAQARSARAPIDRRAEQTAGVERRAEQTAGVERRAEQTAGVERRAEQTAGVERRAEQTAGVERRAEQTAGVAERVSERGGDTAPSDGDSHGSEVVAQEPPSRAPTPTELYLLRAYLAAPTLLSTAPPDLWDLLEHGKVRLVLEKMLAQMQRPGHAAPPIQGSSPLDVDRLVSTLEDSDAARLAADAVASRAGFQDPERQVRECTMLLRLSLRRRSVERAHREAEAQGDAAAINSTLREMLAVDLELKLVNRGPGGRAPTPT